MTLRASLMLSKISQELRKLPYTSYLKSHVEIPIPSFPSVLSVLSFLSACLSCLSFGSGQLINHYGVNTPPLKRTCIQMTL